MDTPIEGTLQASGAIGDTLTFKIIAQGALGTATLIDAHSGAFTYAPNPGAQGTDIFTFVASLIDNDTISTDVIPVTVHIQPPAANSYSPPNAANDSISINANTSGDLDVLANDIDSTDALDPASISIATAPTNGQAVPKPDGKITYTPNQAFVGTDIFTYTVADVGGAVSNPAKVTVIVLPVGPANNAPLANSDSAIIPKNSPATTVNVLANDMDPDQDPLMVIGVSKPTNGTTAVGSGGSNVIYTPTTGFTGVNTFVYTISDGRGGNASTSITITVVNSPPTADPQVITTNEDAPIDIILTGADANNDSLTFAVSLTATHGTLGPMTQLTSNSARLTYTPSANYYGTDSFTFTTNDGSLNSPQATVIITVNPVNDPPTVNTLNPATNEDTSTTLTLSGADVDSSSLTFAVASAPAHGTLGHINNTTCSSGIPVTCSAQITYTPDTNYNGPDTFTFTANDGTTNSSPGIVAITINPVNDPPVANTQNTSVDENTALPIILSGSDVDSTSLTFSSAAAAHGTLSAISNTICSTGLPANCTATVTYTPNADYYGIDSFTFTTNDGTVTSTPATVNVTVNFVNSPPVAKNDAFMEEEDSVSNTLTVLADNGNGPDSDPNGDTLTIIGVGTPDKGGSVSINASKNVLLYTPAAGFFGTESFTYTISDGHGGTASATVTATVNGSPTAKDDAFTIDENSSSNTLNILADNGSGADSDPDGDTLTIIAVGTPDKGGSISINGAQNALLYTPAANFTGTETFNYTISDGRGGTSTAIVSIAVTNTPPTAVNDIFSVPLNSSNNILSVLADNGSGADTDPDSDTLTIIATGTPDKGGSVSINGTQTALFYTPAVNFAGTESFTYTISDGHGGTSTAMVTANIAFSDDFSNGMSNWTTVDNTALASSWSVVSGTLQELNRVESRASGYNQSYHLGTYTYYTAGIPLTNYSFSVTGTFLGTGLADDIGIMFRYQNDNNYYRLSMNSRYGFTRLEKKVNGIFTPLAVNAIGYSAGEVLTFNVDVNGSLIQVMVNGEPLFAVNDTSLTSGSVALYTQDTASFDNVTIQGAATTPTVTLATPVAYTVTPGNTLSSTAIATNVPAGGSIEFLLDGTTSIVDNTAPYRGAFQNILQGDHTIETIVHDAANVIVAQDTNTLIGVQGDYYVAIGDSITNGEGDNYAVDDHTDRMLSFNGYEANLSTLLENSLHMPVIVYNEGIGGDESSDAAFIRINSILARHPDSNKALVLLGTNDALANIPTGSGCNGSACSGTYKGNMQALINTLISAGKQVWVSRIPPIFGNSYSSPFSNPSTASVNTSFVQQYNAVINNELSNRQLGPDLYSYFLGAGQNRFSLFANVWHPNALGHVMMAYLWHNALNSASPVALPFVLDNLSPSTTSPYLKQNLLEVGNTYYVDSTYTLTTIPPALANGRWIMTDDASRNNTSSSYITFDIDRAATVYIAYDSGATTLPNWMGGFSDTGMTLSTSDPYSPTLRLYSRTYSAGHVVLGGNMASGASGANSNYIPIVVSN